MHILASRLKHLPVVSLQTGDPVATVTEPVILAANFKLAAFYCQIAAKRNLAVIQLQAIRQITPHSVIVNSSDEIADPHDLVRFSNLKIASYKPIGKLVISEIGRRLGTVKDYELDLDTGHIQKLYVRRSLLMALWSDGLILDRTQIIDVSPRQITVRDSMVKVPMLSEPTPELPS